jgi:hypothetical protein
MTKHEMNDDSRALLKPIVLTPKEAQQVAGGFVAPIPVPKSPIPWDDLLWRTAPSLPPTDSGAPVDNRPWPTFPH